MAWYTIRKATSEDCKRFDDAAARFVKRHKLAQHYTGDLVHPIDILNLALSPDRSEPLWNLLSVRAAYLRPLWKQCVRRALGPGADGVRYTPVAQSGLVGYESI